MNAEEKVGPLSRIWSLIVGDNGGITHRDLEQELRRNKFSDFLPWVNFDEELGAFAAALVLRDVHGFLHGGCPAPVQAQLGPLTGEVVLALDDLDLGLRDGLGAQVEVGLAVGGLVGTARKAARGHEREGEDRGEAARAGGKHGLDSVGKEALGSARASGGFDAP